MKRTAMIRKGGILAIKDFRGFTARDLLFGRVPDEDKLDYMVYFLGSAVDNNDTETIGALSAWFNRQRGITVGELSTLYTALYAYELVKNPIYKTVTSTLRRISASVLLALQAA